MIGGITWKVFASTSDGYVNMWHGQGCVFLKVQHCGGVWAATPNLHHIMDYTTDSGVYYQHVWSV